MGGGGGCLTIYAPLNDYYLNITSLRKKTRSIFRYATLRSVQFFFYQALNCVCYHLSIYKGRFRLDSDEVIWNQKKHLIKEGNTYARLPLDLAQNLNHCNLSCK